MATHTACSSAAGVKARVSAGLLLAACCSLVAATAGHSPAEGQQPPAAQARPPAQQGQGQPPVFRAGANFVRVDVYPTAGGKPVNDLEQADFVVLEDGVPQKVETWEHVVIQAPSVQDRTTVRDPNTVAQSRQMVAESKARLFVLFLDTYHISREGAMNARLPLIRFLNRALGPDDLIAVTSPELPVSAVTFARRTDSIENLLEQAWRWSRRATLTDFDPIEEQYMRCYPKPPGEFGVMSATAEELINRRRERITLEALQALVVHLGGLREERKAVLAVTEGWILYDRNTRVSTPTLTGLSRLDSEMSRCETDRAVFAQEDHPADFRRMLADANRANVSFYPLDPRGLVAFDTAISERPVSPSTDFDRLRARIESLRTMAENTDGLAIVNSNDIDRGLRQVVDDLTSYYLLGYYSSNAKLDGRFRTITVRVKRPGIEVRHRRGYRAPTQAEMKEMTAVADASASPAAPSPVAGAVAALGRIRTDAAVQARAGYVWTAGPDGAPAPVIWVVGEWDPAVALRDEQWKAGAEVTYAVTAPDKTSLETSRQMLTREARSFLVRIPVPAGQSAGEYALRITTRPAGTSLGSTETIRVVVPAGPAAGAAAIGQPLLFRRGPFTGPDWIAAGDLRFRRQERVKVEVAILGPVASSQVRLLDRAGQLLNVPVTAAEREENGSRVISGELVLAPLGFGDYVLETTIALGATAQKVVVAFKIVP